MTIRPPLDPCEIDRRVGNLAARQYGVVARAQLDRLGLNRGAVLVRMRHGWLRPVHRGVYAVGHSRLDDRGRWLAGVLAGGGAGAANDGDGPAVTVALSHRSAAALLGLGPDRRGAPVELTVSTPRASRDRLRVHRSASIEGATTTRDGIPCTNVARTLVDLAAVEGGAASDRRWSTAASRNLIRPAQVARELRARPRHRGVVVVRAAFEQDFGVLRQRTRSDLERDALRFCREFELPRPRANELIVLGDETFEADLMWPEQRLIVEVDGGKAHGHAAARRRDRRRDAILQLAGWRTIRIGESELEFERPEVAARLRAALAQPMLAAAPGR